MKKKIILTAILSIFMAIAVSAQTAQPDFTGVWELDTVKSTLPQQMQVESIKLKVLHTEKELKIDSLIKLKPSPALSTPSLVQTTIYRFDGQETISATSSEMLPGTDTRKATVSADGKLNLTLIRNLKNKDGDTTIKTNEIWELLDAGNTLKALRYTETPRGAVNAEMYFTRQKGIATRIGSNTDSTSSAPNSSTNETPPVTYTGKGNAINGGVLNGKAQRLVKPEYPPAARAVKATGAVNVQITIDEQGKVIAASAISGHPLLRAAAEQAARESEFEPTLLKNEPVQITGIIVYNFVP